MGEWAKVLYGLVLSLALGFATGWAVCKLVTLICRGMDRRKTNPFFQAAQIFGAAAMSLLYSSLFGIPVSTTHTNTTAIMGVGAVKRLSAINFGVVKYMVLTWVFTFPGCGLISFIMAKLFMAIF